MKTVKDHHLFMREKIYWLRFEKTYKDDNGTEQRVRIRESLKTKNQDEAIKRRDERINEYQARDRNKLRENILQKIRTDSEKIAVIQKDKNKISLSDVWDRYTVSLERNRPKDSTFKQYFFQWDKFHTHIKETAPGKQYLDDITKADAEKFLQGLSKLTPNTYNKILRTLRGIFDVLWKDYPEKVNPFHTFKSRTDIPTSHRELTETELKNIFSKSDGELKVLFAIGYYCGLRLKDAALLDWQNISFRQSRITVIPAKTSSKNKILKIPLHPALKLILLELYTTDQTGYVLPETAANYLIDPTRITNMIQSHFITCGIKTQKTAEGKKAICIAGYHSFRHGYVSNLHDSGVSQAIAMELVGHGSPQIHRLYTHTGEADMTKAVNSIPQIPGTKKLIASGEIPAIDVKADDEPTDQGKRIAEALGFVKVASMPEDTRIKLLAILDGECQLQNKDNTGAIQR